MELTRTCKECGETKMVSEFKKSKRGLHGVVPTCKVCERPRKAAYTREWNARNAERKKATGREAEQQRRVAKTCRNKTMREAYLRKANRIGGEIFALELRMARLAPEGSL